MWEKMLEEMVAFWQSAQVVTILALIGADLLSGVGLALKTRTFDWRRLADFYGSNVIPYILGYLSVWMVARFAVPELLGESAYLVEEAFVWGAWSAIIASIGGSFLSNLKAIGTVKE